MSKFWPGARGVNYHFRRGLGMKEHGFHPLCRSLVFFRRFCWPSLLFIRLIFVFFVLRYRTYNSSMCGSGSTVAKCSNLYVVAKKTNWSTGSMLSCNWIHDTVFQAHKVWISFILPWKMACIKMSETEEGEEWRVSDKAEQYLFKVTVLWYWDWLYLVGLEHNDQKNLW